MRSGAGTAAFLMVLVLGVTGIMCTESIGDGDLWFHLAYARYMISQHTLIPDHTIFSWTPAMGSEIYCAWIPELILYGLHQALGVASLFALRFVCLLSVLAMATLFAWKRKVLLRPLTWLVLLLGILMSQAGDLVKPELFSYVFMGAAVLLWWSVKTDGKGRWWLCYLFPAIMLIWMNSHGGVIFGMILLGTLFAGELMNSFLSKQEALPERSRKHFFISLILCALVTLMTPYGWAYPSQLVRNFLVRGQDKMGDFMTIGAYQTIFHADAIGLHFVDYLALSCLILGVLLWPRIKGRAWDWTLVLMNCVFIVLYVRFIRCTYFWAVIFMFTAISLLAGSPAWGPAISRKAHKHFAAAIIAAALLLSGRTAYESLCGPLFGTWIDYVSPVEEAAFIRSALPGLRLGNDYESGSYLLWSLWPETRVFIDSRYFPYKKWYSEYMGFRTGRDVDSFLKKYPCDLWCLTYNFPGLAYFVRSPEWKLVRYGPSACIFARKDLPVPSGVAKVVIPDGRLTVYQGAKVLSFALKIGDIGTAKAIAGQMSGWYVCPRKKALVFHSHLQLGIALMNHALLDEAEAEFDRALRIDPSSPEPYTRLGDVRVKNGEVDGAIAQYLEALEKEPSFVPAMQKLARAYFMKGRYDEAERYLRELVELEPGNPDHSYNMSCLYARRDNPDESVRWLKSAVDRGFRNWELLESDEDLEKIRQTAYCRELLAGRGTRQ